MTLEVTDGARALRRWLKANGLSIPTFCELHPKLDRIQVQRFMKGERRRVSVDFAMTIERATKGVVKAALWESKTLRTTSDSSPPPPRTGTDDS